MQVCRFQATQCPVGRLQLHWERATKAIHQIPRSKTPDTVTPDSRSASLRSKVLAALSTASAWMSAYLKPGSSALFKRAVVSIAEAGFVHGADTHAMGGQLLACQRKSCISSTLLSEQSSRRPRQLMLPRRYLAPSTRLGPRCWPICPQPAPGCRST